MPQLHNLKHENFCQLTLQGVKYGWSQAMIYAKSGYRATGHTAEVNASRLLKKAEIQNRIRELGAPAIRETAVTARTLVAELEAARAGATTSEQFGAATAAIIAKAKLLGLDQNGNGSGSPFDACQTTEEVVAKWLTEFETPAAALEALDAWRGMIEAYAADHAQIIVPAEMARPRSPGDETAMSLQYLRPKRFRR